MKLHFRFIDVALVLSAFGLSHCKNTGTSPTAELESVTADMQRFFPSNTTYWSCGDLKSGRVTFTVKVDKNPAIAANKKVSISSASIMPPNNSEGGDDGLPGGFGRPSNVQLKECSWVVGQGFSFSCTGGMGKTVVWIATDPVKTPKDFKNPFSNEPIEYPGAGKPSPWMTIAGRKLVMPSCIARDGGDEE